MTQKATRRAQRTTITSTDADKCMTLKKYLQDYVSSYVNIAETETLVNDQMAVYEEREQTRSEQLAAKRGVADEDGFVTIVSAKPRTAGLDADAMTATAQGRVFDPFHPLQTALAGIGKEKSVAAATRPLNNFYRFQVRQKQTGGLDELKRKFEEDKRRISELKRDKLFA